MYDDLAKLFINLYIDCVPPDQSRGILEIDEYVSEKVMLPEPVIATLGLIYFRGLFFRRHSSLAVSLYC